MTSRSKTKTGALEKARRVLLRLHSEMSDSQRKQFLLTIRVSWPGSRAFNKISSAGLSIKDVRELCEEIFKQDET